MYTVRTPAGRSTLDSNESSHCKFANGRININYNWIKQRDYEKRRILKWLLKKWTSEPDGVLAVSNTLVRRLFAQFPVRLNERG